MQWREIDDGYGTKCFQGEVHIDSAGSMVSHSSEIWTAFRALVAPLHRHIAWDVVRIELWADSGRMIVFPATSSFEERVDVAVLEVLWDVLLEAWNAFEAESELEPIRPAQVALQKTRNCLFAAMRRALGQREFEGRRVDCYVFDEFAGSFDTMDI